MPLGQRNEQVRRHRLDTRRLPPRQRLQPGHPPSGQRDLRLKRHRDFAVDRARQLDGTRHSGHGTLVRRSRGLTSSRSKARSVAGIDRLLQRAPPTRSPSARQPAARRPHPRTHPRDLDQRICPTAAAACSRSPSRAPGERFASTTASVLSRQPLLAASSGLAAPSTVNPTGLTARVASSAALDAFIIQYRLGSRCCPLCAVVLTRCAARAIARRSAKLLQEVLRTVNRPECHRPARMPRPTLNAARIDKAGADPPVWSADAIRPAALALTPCWGWHCSAPAQTIRLKPFRWRWSNGTRPAHRGPLYHQRRRPSALSRGRPAPAHRRVRPAGPCPPRIWRLADRRLLAPSRRHRLRPARPG